MWCSLLLLLASGPQDSGPTVELESLAGAIETRPLADFHVSDPREQDAHFVRFRGLEPPRPPVGLDDHAALVTLHSGDRVRGWVRSGAGERLVVELVGRLSIELSADEVRSVVFTSRLRGGSAPRPDPSGHGDWLYRRNGDAVPGLINGFSDEGVDFEGKRDSRTYPWRDVLAIFIEDLGEPGEAQDDARAPVFVDLAGGSRLRGRLVEIDSRGCSLAVRPGEPLLLPAAGVLEVAVRDGSFAYLSDIAPADRGPESPFGDDLGMVYAPRVDRAVVSAGPLRVAGRTWARGLGVHAPSRLTWALDGEWSQLRTWAGIDDEALEIARTGSVRFLVEVDGEERFASMVRHGGEPALELPPVDLSGARELVLEVDAASDHWVADRADWLRPILVRAP